MLANITWPTSTVTFLLALIFSANCAAAGGKAVLALIAIGVELHMREMQRQALRGVDRRERRLDIAGKAEIVHVQMQRMRNLRCR